MNLFRAWSLRTTGPGARTLPQCSHSLHNMRDLEKGTRTFPQTCLCNNRNMGPFGLTLSITTRNLRYGEQEGKGKRDGERKSFNF